MKFIKKHKVGLIVSLVCLVLIILAGIAVYSMFNPSNKGVYGNRLAGEVLIEDATISTIKEKLNSSGIVITSNYRKSVRTLKFTINVKDNTKLEDAYKLSDIIIDNLSKEAVGYYDIEIYLTENTENVNYPTIGYRSNKASRFTWVNNKEVPNE